MFISVQLTLSFQCEAGALLSIHTFLLLFLSHTQTPNKQVGEIFLNYFLKVSSTVGSIVGGELELASKHIRLPG